MPDTLTSRVSTLELNFSEEELAANDPLITQFSPESAEISRDTPEAELNEDAEVSIPPFKISTTNPESIDVVERDAATDPVILRIADETWLSRLIPDSAYSFSIDAPPLLVSQIVFGVWIFISSVLLCRLFLSGLLVFRLKREASVAPPVVEQVTSHWLGATKSVRHVEVGVSHAVRSAVAVGYVHPMVLLPQTMLDALEREEVEQVILHELAHIRRFDDWTILTQQFAKVFLFFHPGIWILSRLMNQDREIACDDWVVSISRQPKKYASCLAKIAALNIPGYSPIAVAPATSSKKQLFVRVKSILEKRLSDSYRTSRMVFVSMLLIGLAIFVGISHWAPVVAFAEKKAETLQSEDLFSVERAEGAEIEEVEAPTIPVKGSDDALEGGGEFIYSVEASRESIGSEAQEERTIAPPDEPEFNTIGDVEPEAARIEIHAPSSPAPLDTNETLRDLYPLNLTDSELVSVEDKGLLSLANLFTLTLTDSDPLRLIDFSETQGAAQSIRPSTGSQEPAPKAATDKVRPLSKRSMIRWLEAVRRMPTPGEKKILLEKATFQLPVDDDVHIAFLDATMSISSRQHKVGLMALLLGRSELEKEGIIRYLEVVRSLPSSDDRYGLLSTLLISDERFLVEDEQVNRLVKSIMETVTKTMHYQGLIALYARTEREINENQ